MWCMVVGQAPFIHSFARWSIRSLLMVTVCRLPFILSFIILQQILSLSEQLVKARQSCLSQMERADYLEAQCTLLNGKVENLLQKIAQKDKDGFKTTTAVQTNDMSKARFISPYNHY